MNKNSFNKKGWSMWVSPTGNIQPMSRIFLVNTQIGGKWALDLHFNLLLPFSMFILPFPLGCFKQGHTCGSVIEAKSKSTISDALQVPFLTTWAATGWVLNTMIILLRRQEKYKMRIQWCQLGWSVQLSVFLWDWKRFFNKMHPFPHRRPLTTCTYGTSSWMCQ